MWDILIEAYNKTLLICSYSGTSFGVVLLGWNEA